MLISNNLVNVDVGLMRKYRNINMHHISDKEHNDGTIMVDDTCYESLSDLIERLDRGEQVNTIPVYDEYDIIDGIDSSQQQQHQQQQQQQQSSANEPDALASGKDADAGKANAAAAATE